MRCPNCGNENPPDYLFCDECGARLVGNDVAAMSGTPDTGLGADTGGGGGTGTGVAPMQDQAGDDMGGSLANYADYSAGTGQQGTSATSDDSGASSSYMGGDSGQSSTATETDDAGLSAIPVTEDTMAGTPDSSGAGTMPDVIAPIDPIAPIDALTPMQQATADEADEAAAAGTLVDEGLTAGSSAYQDAQESIGGMADDARMSVEEGISGMIGLSGAAASLDSIADSSGEPFGSDDGAAAMPVPVTMGGASGTDTSADSGNNEWAVRALEAFNQAQSALSSGNWGEFGTRMNLLQSTLQAAAGGDPVQLTPPRRIEPLAAGTGTSGDTFGAASPDASLADMTGTGDASAPAIDDYLASSVDYSPSTAAPDPAAGIDSQAWDMQGDAGSAGTDTATDAGGYVGADQSMSGADGGVVGTVPTALQTPAWEQPPTSAVPAGVPPTTTAASGAKLILISTGAEMALPEQEEITVGREDPSSGIFPDVDLTPFGGEDGGVSRRHARLLHIGDDYFVEDLQSTNFTKLDGQRLPAHVRERLEDGARLDFGRVAMIFRRN